MKSWPDPQSPWGKQIRFDDHEFESMMDEMRERAWPECYSAGRGVDVDLVLLKAVKTEADYVDLPPGIMGRTIFQPSGAIQIEISKSLSDEAESNATARRRLRSTLAHECGHVACHGHLYLRDTATLSLFGDNIASSGHGPIMCRHEVVKTSSYNGEWWEFQANRCMGALLLPRILLNKAVKTLLSDSGYASTEECLRRGCGEALVRAITDQFDVSQILTVIRLQGLGHFPRDAQRTLNLAE